MDKEKILVVDDEENVRSLLAKVLEKKGYTVWKACNGLEGMEIIHSKNVDIIISDIKMPHMDGIEFLHKVKKIEPDIGFILITAFATVETAIEALKCGAQDYVQKPFDIDDILCAVKKISINNSFPVNQEKVNSKSKKMQEVLKLSKQVAQSASTVLITGETGTGKEVISAAIHRWSKRKEAPMIKVNCGAIPDNLLESELFGYEKGAFTGAVTAKPGRFELAHGGTILLDEIGDISPAIQIKLLRVLQEKSFERLGGIKSINVDVRVITATNKNLKKEVEANRFREDLYYRLNVVPIHLPPLRERPEDIEGLINFFLDKAAENKINNERKHMDEEALECMKAYYWPGNIRELENIIERCVVITSGNKIYKESLPAEIVYEDLTEKEKCLTDAMDNKEKEVILEALKSSGGNKTKAAEAIGISRRSLHRKIQKYNIFQD